MISLIISLVLISLSVYASYSMYKNDKSLIRTIYFTKPLDYLLALLIIIPTFFLLSFLIGSGMPEFLKFSWLNLIGSEGTNLIANPVSAGESLLSVLISSLFFVVLVLCLPYLANSEEIQFRSMSFGLKSRIKQSIKFGFIHMIVGVPVYIAILLCFIGYIFSIKYCLSFNKNIDKGVSEADRIAIIDATSLHAKYNLIIIFFVYLLSLVIVFNK